jgi:hypothetical protein
MTGPPICTHVEIVATDPRTGRHVATAELPPDSTPEQIEAALLRVPATLDAHPERVLAFPGDDD